MKCLLEPRLTDRGRKEHPCFRSLSRTQNRWSHMYKRNWLLPLFMSWSLVIQLSAYERVKVKKGALVFEDTFSRSGIGDAWKSHADSFSIEDGKMKATQLPDA